MLTIPMAELPTLVLHAERAFRVREPAVGKLLKDKWAELLILAVMVPAFGWLFSAAWDQNSRTVALETRMAAFVNAMPELRRGVASETLSQPFRSAVVVYQPNQVGNAWLAQIEIVDPAKGDVTTYIAKLDKSGRESLDLGVIGSVKRADFDAMNFRQMQEKERVAGLEVGPLPTAINRESSFVIYTDPKDIGETLKTFGFRIIDVKPAIGVETWPHLKRALSDGTLRGKR